MPWLGIHGGTEEQDLLIQRRAYGIKYQEYLVLRVITSFITAKKAD